jgi:ParB family chromosome partitioning protein
VRKLLEEGQLSIGHAKVLLAVEDPAQIARLAREVVAEGLTVRELERRLREVATTPGKKKAGRPRKADQQPEVRRIEDRLRKYLQTDVALNMAKGNRGTLTIQFYSADDLERVLELLHLPA